MYTKESLESLRQRVDLIEVLNSHLDLKRAGAAYKGLCPFHDEKSPSFMVQRGDTHYHCYGCGAHGDAIQFLIEHQRLTFSDAVEHLAQRFGVVLDVIENLHEKKGTPKTKLKETLQHASELFHFYLLHTAEGQEALNYLYSRDLSLDFIKQFGIGLSPKRGGILRRALHAKFVSDELMLETGLLAPTRDGGFREFFNERIMFPIRDATGSVIGFSGRKFHEETFGGKYVNTSETPLFKKSRVLFGLNYCRKRIAKEKQAIIVEGQLDALRLIHAGLNLTVAGQGTAFGEGHVRELLQLGVNRIFLALDSDPAGLEAAVKIGNLFMKEGVEVKVTVLPPGDDPDTFVRKNGAEPFVELLQRGIDFLEFLLKHRSRAYDLNNPAGKNQLAMELVKEIRSWEQSLLVHESLIKLAALLKIPESMLGVGQEVLPNVLLKRSASAGFHAIDPDRIMETDFLRILFLEGLVDPAYVTFAQANLSPEDLSSSPCANLYKAYLHAFTNELERDLMSLAIQVEDPEIQLVIAELHQRKVNREKSKESFKECILKILNRNWMHQREQIRMAIQSGQMSDDEAILKVKEFEEIKKSPPKIKGEL